MEIRDLDTGVHPGWPRTGKTFYAYEPGATHGQIPPVHRFYGLPSAKLDTHVYTLGASAETFNLMVAAPSASWQFESYDAFELPYPNAPIPPDGGRYPQLNELLDTR